MFKNWHLAYTTVGFGCVCFYLSSLTIIAFFGAFLQGKRKYSKLFYWILSVFLIFYDKKTLLKWGLHMVGVLMVSILFPSCFRDWYCRGVDLAASFGTIMNKASVNIFICFLPGCPHYSWAHAYKKANGFPQKWKHCLAPVILPVDIFYELLGVLPINRGPFNLDFNIC